jgi:hypothetical protein
MKSSYIREKVRKLFVELNKPLDAATSASGESRIDAYEASKRYDQPVPLQPSCSKKDSSDCCEDESRNEKYLSHILFSCCSFIKLFS